jgi:putative FmdB family regulatory protein
VPAYDFRCGECKAVVEVVRPIGSRDPVACPECGGETKRLFSPVGVVFKGSGFHNTDYRASDSSDAPKGEESTPCSSADASSDACSTCPSAPGND